MSDKFILSFPFLFGGLALVLSYLLMMCLTGPFFSMFIAPVFSILATIIVYLSVNKPLGRISDLDD